MRSKKLIEWQEASRNPLATVKTEILKIFVMIGVISGVIMYGTLKFSEQKLIENEVVNMETICHNINN